jgi:signal transduction histidine kinase
MVGIALAALLITVFVVPRVTGQLMSNLDVALSSPTAMMADTLAQWHGQHHSFDGALERISPRFRIAVAIVPRSDLKLEASMLQRLDGGEVVREGPPANTMIFARIEGTSHVLQVGPLLTAHPLGGLRGVTIFLLVIMGISLGVYGVLRPIRRQLLNLARTAEALGRGELSARAEPGSRDAIGALARTINKMADEIQRLVAAQEELLRMTSHELRTPIQKMHFSLERLRDTAQDERALDLLERDLSELDRLIDELLSYVRLKGHVAPVREAVRMRPLLRELCEELSALSAGATLVGPGPSPAADDDALTVNVEARLVRRAVSNLIVNALRHARSRVEVTLTRDGQTIHVDVDDDGPGVPVADRLRIFEPFQRLDDERTRSRKGFGLGLAIVRRIAETHGGSVVAQGSKLEGAQLRLSFPEGA